MATTEELEKEILAEMAADPVAYAAGPVNDVITIDGETRVISVPASELLFGVETDKDVERKHFRCPRVVGDGIDLSKHQIYISYITSDSTGKSFSGDSNLYLCEDVAVDDDDITFSWQLSGNVFASAGFISFKVLAAKTDGENVQTRWNTVPAVGTVLMTVPDGMDIGEAYPDIVTQLLERMASVEKIATEEAMQGYVNTYLEAHPGEIDETLTDPKKAAPASVVGELKKDLDKQITVDKLSGYYNLAKKATVHKNKCLIGYNTTTFEPNMIDYDGFTTIVMEIDESFGRYNAFVSTEKPPRPYTVAMRYTSNKSASTVAYSQLNSLTDVTNWDCEYDSEKRIFTYYTDKIMQYNVANYAFCFYNIEPLVFPEIIPTLDSGKIQLKKFVSYEQLDDEVIADIKEGVGGKNNWDCEIVLPREIPIASGKQLNIYYENILYNKMLNQVFMNTQQTDVTTGNFYGDKYQTTFESESLIKKYANIRVCHKLDSPTVKSVSIPVVPLNYKTGNYNVMVIGDSKIEAGVIMRELDQLFTDDTSMNVSFVGTRGGLVKHEGRSGWSAKEYCLNKTYGGATNAFYNNGTFDFSNYMSVNGFDSVDLVCVNLGTNDASRVGSGDATAFIESYYEPMIDSIHAYSTSCKILIGLAENVYQGGKIAYGMDKNKILGFVKALIKKYDTDEYRANGIYLIPIYVNQNLLLDYNFNEVAESVRNQTMFSVPTDVVHQSNSGYYKNADMIYSAIKYYI